MPTSSDLTDALTGSVRLRVSLTDDERLVLDSVKGHLRSDMKVRSMGAPVTDQVALRFVLMVGLDRVPTVLRGGRGQETAVSPAVAESATPPLEPEETPAPAVVALEPEAEPPMPAELLRTYKRPAHWEYYDDGEWELPPGQEELHAYYTAAGWIRCAAGMDGRTLQFYWTPNGAEQGLPPHPGRDDQNRMVLAQRAPEIGVAHLVPEDWGEDRAATEAAAVWSPPS